MYNEYKILNNKRWWDNEKDNQYKFDSADAFNDLRQRRTAGYSIWRK